MRGPMCGSRCWMQRRKSMVRLLLHSPPPSACEMHYQSRPAIRTFCVVHSPAGGSKSPHTLLWSLRPLSPCLSLLPLTILLSVRHNHCDQYGFGLLPLQGSPQVRFSGRECLPPFPCGDRPRSRHSLRRALSLPARVRTGAGRALDSESQRRHAEKALRATPPSRCLTLF